MASRSSLTIPARPATIIGSSTSGTRQAVASCLMQNPVSDCMLLGVITWNEFRGGNAPRIALSFSRMILLLLQAAALVAYGQARSNSVAAPAGANAPVAITLDDAIRLA